MPIANVDITNSLEYFRMITNQCIIAWNALTNDNTDIVRIVVNPIDTTTVTFNVASGLIIANGANIFSYPNTGLVGTFTNSQLQNTNISMSTATGTLVGTNSASLNSGTITITSSVIDSLSNTSAFRPAAANAIPRLISAVGQFLKTTGEFAVNVGGTGRQGTAYYVNGQILLTNVAGVLSANSIPNRSGIIASGRAGSIALDADIVTVNATASWTIDSGITITQNVYLSASPTVPGVMQITDTLSSLSITSGASSNSLNAVANIVSLGAGSSSYNGFGRLINVQTYEYASAVGSDTKWTVPNIAQVAFIIVTAISNGGRGGGANNGNSNTNYVASGAGGSGTTLKGIITYNQLVTFNDVKGTGNLTVLVGPESDGSQALDVPGTSGTIGANVRIGQNGTGYIFLLEGGTPSPNAVLMSNVGLGTSNGSNQYIPARVLVNTLAGIVIQSSCGWPGAPGIIIQKGHPGGTGPSYTAGIGGIPVRPQWERAGVTEDAFDKPPYFSSNNSASGIGGGGLFSNDEFAYGMGGPGGVSLRSQGGPSYSRTGGESGSGFILIETYSNA